MSTGLRQPAAVDERDLVDTVIGVDLPRRDARDKVRGRTRFAVDRSPQGALHGVLARATVPAGVIRSLDVAVARDMPGVRAVVTGTDAPGRYGIGVADHPLMAIDRVRYVGEPVAAIAADSPSQARAAARAVGLVLEATPANLTMASSLAEGAELVHPDWADDEVLVPGGSRFGNVAWEAVVVRGDVDAAFGRQDVRIVETTFVSGRQNQASLEPRVCTASWEDGRCRIETSTQVPWSVRDNTARMLGISSAQIHVTVPPVGGGFGLKFEPALEPVAALLSRQAGRAVHMHNTRQEEMQTALARENAEVRIRSAIAPDGSIAGREAVVLMDCGAYGGEQPFLAAMTAHTLGGNYRVGAIRIVSRVIYTNTPPTGAFRCCNGTYCTAALEAHTDDICEALGARSWDYRRVNVIGGGDVGATGQVFESDVLGPMLDVLTSMRPAAPPTDDSSDRRLFGRGLAVGTWFVFTGPSAATVNLNPDGTVTLVTAGVEIGSGSTVQAIPQLVAESLGLSPAQVVVRAADTDAAGYDVGVGGGRTTVSLGNAALDACREVKSKLVDLAADVLEADPRDMEFVDGGVRLRGAPEVSLGIDELAHRAQSAGGPIAGAGSFTAGAVARQPGCVRGHMVEGLDIPVFAVHECDVAVDPDTGSIEVLDYRVVQDVGRAINPRAIRGQVQGGVVQGLGYAIHEEITIGTDGWIEQSGFEGYRVPLSGDVVAIRAELYEGAPSSGPLGAKGAGEIPILNVAAAVGAAVRDATGVGQYEIPITPPRLLARLVGRTPSPGLAHIPRDWTANVLGDVKAMLADGRA